MSDNKVCVINIPIHRTIPLSKLVQCLNRSRTYLFDSKDSALETSKRGGGRVFSVILVIVGVVLIAAVAFSVASNLQPGKSTSLVCLGPCSQSTAQTTSSVSYSPAMASTSSEPTDSVQSSSSTSSYGTQSTTSEPVSTTTTQPSVELNSSESCPPSNPAPIPTAFADTLGLPAQAYVRLFGNYSQMGVSVSEVSTGNVYVSETFTSYTTNGPGSTQVNESYNVIYASATTYKVSILEAQSGITVNATAWVQKDGTVIAYDYLGQNNTGPEAAGLLQGLLSPLVYEAEYSTLVEPLTSVSTSTAMSSGSVVIGSTDMKVTNYSAATVPLQVAICGGSLDLSSYSMQTGTTQGSPLQPIVSLKLAGSETYEGQTSQIMSLDFELTNLKTG
jgi:hypothetical protein